MNQPLPPVPSPAAAWLEQQQLQYVQNDIELSGRILMSAIIALSFLLCLFIIFHVFRLFLHRAFSGSPLFDQRSYHHRHHRRRRHPNFVFVFSGPDPPDHSTGRMPKGLDPAVLRSLPFFVFSSLVHEKGLECSVCLCEFEEEERGRALGGCGHCFHIDCIDLWFQSHSTCPLCRAEVKSPPPPSATGETPQLGLIPLGAAVECTASEEELSVGVHHVPQAAETENPESAKPLPPTPPPPPPPETRFVGLRNFLSRERWVGSSNDFSSNDVDLEVGGREPQGQEVKR